MLGTVDYMSPEQIRGEEGDARSDQFSFCVALYQALYGERGYWARPLAMFTETVTVDGRERPRLELVEAS